MKEKICYATTLKNVVTPGGAPQVPVGKRCLVYFNPKSPKNVAIKGFHQVEKPGYGLLIFRVLGIFFYFIFILTFIVGFFL